MTLLSFTSKKQLNSKGKLKKKNETQNSKWKGVDAHVEGRLTLIHCVICQQFRMAESSVEQTDRLPLHILGAQTDHSDCISKCLADSYSVYRQLTGDLTIMNLCYVLASSRISCHILMVACQQRDTPLPLESLESFCWDRYVSLF